MQNDVWVGDLLYVHYFSLQANNKSNCSAASTKCPKRLESITKLKRA